MLLYAKILNIVPSRSVGFLKCYIKLYKVRLIFLLACLTLFSAQAIAQMTDDQVLKLLQQAQQEGKTQQETVLMLSQKGVTQEQLIRIKNNLGKDNKDATRVTTVSDSRLRNRKQKETIDSLLISYENQKELKPKKVIFGHNIFNQKSLTFEPNLNIATPENYVLGPGDEVIIDVWGDSEQALRQTISPDGNIVVDRIGPVYLNGLTVKEANVRLKRIFSQIYSAIGTTEPTTFVKLSLGQIRSIQVHVMGEVVVPGTYTLPSLASLFHALYHAGGINDIGTLRSIKVHRNGKQIADIDVYSYLLEGKNDLDISMKDGDVIVVSPYRSLVTCNGKIKRPMIYEMKDSETLAGLLNYAGGFTGDAYKKEVRVVRKSGREHQVYNVDESDYKHFALTDGDIVSIDSVLSRFENRIEIKGAVYREGIYALNGKVSTIKQLIDKAEGIRGDAFLNRAVLYREKPDLTQEVISIDIAGLLNGSIGDMPLQKNDMLYIPSIFDLREDYIITVQGAVGTPGVYKYVDNMSLEDAVVQAGGLLESASTVRVDVARRIKNYKSMYDSDQRAENFTFTLKDGLVVSGEKSFVLAPFDVVYVRTSPGYQVQRNVYVEGEVLFGGEYALSKKGERLTDLIKKSGGLTSSAYPVGARLIRKMNADEQARLESMMKLVKSGERDSIDMSRLELGAVYYVGIELDKAMKQPGSYYDVVLREGDRLVVPEYSGTVKISGAVMYPNTVVYRKDAKLKYYIGQGGGFADRAKKRKAFIVYMNGTVVKSKAFAKAKVTPGCEIIVPAKTARRETSLSEIMSIASSTTSMAALVASILNMTK